MDFCSPNDLWLSFQSCPTRPHKEVSCLLSATGIQEAACGENSKGSAEVMKSSVDLADEKRTGNEGLVTPPIIATLFQVASPSDPEIITDIGLW